MNKYVVIRVNSAKQFWMVGIYNSEHGYDSAIVKDSKLSGYVTNYTAACTIATDKDKWIKKVIRQIHENEILSFFLTHSFGYKGDFNLVGYYEVWGYEKPNYSYYLVVEVKNQV